MTRKEFNALNESERKEVKTDWIIAAICLVPFVATMVLVFLNV